MTKPWDLRYLQTLERFLEERLSYLRGWSRQVQTTALAIGQMNGLSDESLASLATGAFFHDLGLLAIPDNLLEAGRTLSREEQDIVDRHVQYGGQLLNLAYYDYPEVLEVVWFHHERLDGKGPLGLTGDLIPLSARITSVTDAVVSMFNPRPHRARLSREEILTELGRGAGTQFDERIVRTVQRAANAIFDGLLTTEEGDAAPCPATPVEQAVKRSHRPVAPTVAPKPAARAERAERAEREEGVDTELPDINARLKDVAQLSALPTPVCEVIALASNRDTDRAKLAKAIKQDVALTTKLLAVANSSAYRRGRRKISTIDEAIGKLGFSTIASVAVGMNVLRTEGTSEDSPVEHTRLWGHSISVGLIASALAPADDPQLQEAMFVGGLVHDVGKFVLTECFPEFVPRLVNVTDAEIEQSIVGLDHARLGAKVLLRWDMPAELVRAVRGHHRDWEDPAKWLIDDNREILMVQLADALAIALGLDSGFLDYLPRIPARVLEQCPGAGELNVAEVQQMVRDQLRDVGAMLGIRWPFPCDTVVLPTGASAPAANYVAESPPVIDPLGVWLQYSKGFALQPVELDAAAATLDRDLPTLVHLPDEISDERCVEHVAALLNMECHLGLVVAPPVWSQHLPNPLAAGWRRLSESISVRDLDTLISQSEAIVNNSRLS